MVAVPKHIAQKLVMRSNYVLHNNFINVEKRQYRLINRKTGKMRIEHKKTAIFWSKTSKKDYLS